MKNRVLYIFIGSIVIAAALFLKHTNSFTELDKNHLKADGNDNSKIKDDSEVSHYSGHSNKDVKLDINRKINFIREQKQRKKERLLSDSPMPADMPEDATEDDLLRLAEITPSTNPVLFEMAEEVIDDMWREQKHDEQWTNSISEALSESVENGDFGERRVDFVDCREQICKVKVSMKGIDKDEEFRGAWSRSLYGKTGEQYGRFENDEDGNKTAIVYFSKPNHVKPFIELRERIYNSIDS